MIIDFHTHCYPDALAPRALSGVDDDAEGDSDGTLAGMLAELSAAGVDRAVLLPVCPRPGHEKTVNDFALSVSGERIIPFFSVHPFTPGADELIREYAKRGYIGVKFHPNLQRFVLGDPKLLPVWRAVRDCKLIAVFHCGRPGRRDTEYDVYPSDFIPLFGTLDPHKVVLAHTGGYGISDKEIELLAHTEAYADLSISPKQFSPERFARVLDLIPPSRLLFGSDTPWGNTKITLDMIRSSVSDPDALSLILGDNARRLLGI